MGFVEHRRRELQYRLGAALVRMDWKVLCGCLGWGPNRVPGIAVDREKMRDQIFIVVIMDIVGIMVSTLKNRLWWNRYNL